MTLVTVGMLVSAFAPNLAILITARVVTGVGVSATMAAINTVTAEQANDRRRDLAVCLQATGFPLGGTLGALALLVMPDLGWRAVFLAGAVLSMVLIMLVLALLPESFGFLISRRPKGALERLNRQLVGWARIRWIGCRNRLRLRPVRRRSIPGQASPGPRR